MADARSTVYWSIRELTEAFAARELSPLDVTETVLERIEAIDSALHAYLSVTPELAREQARAAEDAYAAHEESPLLGIPISVKDVFHVSGYRTTLGSRVYRNRISARDSGVARRLRRAGAVFVGKTNTAEFGQSATTDNLLQPDTANPWDPTRTPGGSSGGAAASVAAGLATAAVGSDGGGSIRIPASFTGLFGLKPTPRLCPDEDGFVAMEQFVAPGPLTWRVADARVLLGVLADSSFPRRRTEHRLHVAYCPRPESKPVSVGVQRVVARAATTLNNLGHHVDEVDLPLEGWKDVFAPLVLEEETKRRGHLLDEQPENLTIYERKSLEAGRELASEDIVRAQEALPAYRARIAELFTDVDLLLTPTTAVPAFELGQRPDTIDGEAVDALWGAFPFAVPFNVGGVPAASVPCGLVDDLPVGAQLVGPAGHEWVILDVAEQLEEALAFDASPVIDAWATPAVLSSRD